MSESDVWRSAVEINFSDKTHVSAPSGTGKTTLCGILYGLRTDFSGEFLIQEQSSKIVSWEEERKLRLSVVFQDLKLMPDQSAWENILVKNNLTQHFTHEEIVAGAKQLGIAELLEKEVQFLSRGEQQRVAILRSLCTPFKCILLDEPFSHLDPENQRKAAGLIEEQAAKNGAGIVMMNLQEDQCFTYDKMLKL